MLGVFIKHVHLQQQPGNWQDIDLAGVQEVKCDKGSTVRVGDYNFFYGKLEENYQFRTGYLYNTEQYQQLRE